MASNNTELIWLLAKTDFKLRYNSSVLGFFWSILKPLFFLVILNFVFSHIFSSDVTYFPLRLITGITLWGFFAEATMSGLVALSNKAYMITKINVSKTMIILASIINSLLSYALSLIVLFFFYIGYGVIPSFLAIIHFIILNIAIIIFIFGFSMLTSYLFLRLRDLNQIWEVFLTAGFWSCPIVYPMSAIPVNVQPYLYINPMTPIIVYTKDVLIDGIYPSFESYGILFLAFIVIGVVSYFIGRMIRHRVVESI